MNRNTTLPAKREPQAGDTAPRRPRQRTRGIHHQPVLDAITAYIAEHGVPPTRPEVMAAVNLKSNATFDLVVADLTQAGKLRKPRRPGAHRFLAPTPGRTAA